MRVYLYISCLMFVLLHFGFEAAAQKEYVDSIKTRIKIEKNDSEKVRLLVQLGNRVRLSDTAESWRNYQEIEKIASETGNEFFKGMAYFLKATIYLANQPVQSIGNYEKAINIFSRYPGNRRAMLSIGSCYINLGLSHNNSNDYETAVYYYLKAEDAYLKIDPRHSDLSILYSNISITYGTINKFEEGIYYSKKGLDWAKNGKDKNSLMVAYYGYGGNLVNAKKGDSGLAYLDTAKMLATEINDPNYVYSADFMKAMYYYNSKQYRKAIEYYSRLLEFCRQYNYGPGMANNYLNLAACEAELKMPKEAAKHLDSSAKIFDYVVYDASKQMYFENYAEVYRQLGQYDKAFAYKDSVGVIKDSIYRADNIKQIEFRQARYSYEKQQNDIKQLEDEKEIQRLALKQKSTINYLLIGGAVILLVIILLSFRNYQQNKKLHQQRIAELETEKKLAATEAVLKGEEQERSRLAKDLHDGLGGMLSGIKYSLNTMKGNLVMTPENKLSFERSVDMLDGSIREMRRVAHNMMPEALVKFGLDAALKDFCTDINQSGALNVNYQSIGVEGAVIDQTLAITIYRIVQELINNTIKHAGASSAIVQVSKNGDQISVTVEDDGKGFDTALLKTSKGIGWSNIQNRIEFLKGTMDVQSAPGEGVSVHIELTV